MNWWFLSIIILAAIGWGITLEQHGKPKTGNHSLWWDTFHLVLYLFLMYMAVRTGFWRCLNEIQKENRTLEE